MRKRSNGAFSPTASWPRKQLIQIYARRGDYGRAIDMAKAYLAEYPNDRDFAKRFASELFNASHWALAVPLLEPLLQRKADPELYGLLGFAMTRGGGKAEGVALLEKPAALDPNNWWTFYALGYAHFYDGEFPRAVPWFERVLELRPNFPEIEERLRTIRSRPS
jgi:tetratricopeptide (TPR) repeat protein